MTITKDQQIARLAAQNIDLALRLNSLRHALMFAYPLLPHLPAADGRSCGCPVCAALEIDARESILDAHIRRAIKLGADFVANSDSWEIDQEEFEILVKRFKDEMQ